MTLTDLINQLSGSELSNLFDFDADTQEIDQASRMKLIPQLNLGLQLLYNRFFLKEGTEIINMVENVYTYPLQNADVLRIEQVKTIKDDELLLDVEDEPESLMRKNLTTLKTPVDMDPITLVVTYRAGPTKLTKTDGYKYPDNIQIDLPPVYAEALSLFIASRFLNPMGATDGIHEGNNYASKYEQACRLLETQNYDLDRYDNEDTFHSAGWV